jgi:hypothetical protein
MRRVLEPKLMDDPAQAIAYARADFTDVNRGFVERFSATFPRWGCPHFVGADNVRQSSEVDAWGVAPG